MKHISLICMSCNITSYQQHNPPVDLNMPILLNIIIMNEIYKKKGKD